MLAMQNVSHSLGGRKILSGLTFQISYGQHCALVGQNGSGKTTLLNLLRPDAVPDEGRVTVSSTTKIMSLEQEMPTSKESALEYVLGADITRSSLLSDLELDQDPMRLAHILGQLDDIDAYSAPSRAARVLDGLGFPEQLQHKSVDEFSGGMRMRLNLARVLFLSPDILIMDEPTNHLDLESSIWLKNYLVKFQGAILFTSHDRDFLNAVPHMIFELSQGNLTAYAGNYDTYRRTKAEAQKHVEREHLKQEAYKKRLEDYVERNRARKSTAKQAQSRMRILQRMHDICLPPSEDAPEFSFKSAVELTRNPIITCKCVYVGYGDTPVLSDVNLQIGNAEKIAVIGRNGNGKSTFVKALAGELPLLQGNLVYAPKVSIGYLNQSTLDNYDIAGRASDLVRAVAPTLTTKQLRLHLAQFGIDAKLYDAQVSNLSGGERARVAFACLAARKPNVMLLDEPTNHLDIQSREALALALNDYDGTVVFVTHDSMFIAECADRLLLVDKGHVRYVDTDVSAYAKSLLISAGEDSQRNIPKGAHGQKLTNSVYAKGHTPV